MELFVLPGGPPIGLSCGSGLQLEQEGLRERRGHCWRGGMGDTDWMFEKGVTLVQEALAWGGREDLRI